MIDWNRDPLSRESNVITITPLDHVGLHDRHFPVNVGNPLSHSPSLLQAISNAAADKISITMNRRTFVLQWRPRRR